MALKIFNKIKNKTASTVYVGTIGSGNSAENRITIFCNILALFSIVASFSTFFQLHDWGIDEQAYLDMYLAIPSMAVVILLLNYFGKSLLARIVAVLMLNIAAWNALLFYGKSFNGYLLFYAAIVFSIMAFDSRKSSLMWITLIVSALGLPLADYFSYKGILPITDLHSSQAPMSVLVSDSIIIIILIVSMLLIEKFLAERNEHELKALNLNLENIVQKRTELLNVARAEAMAASQAKSQFVANTSHELRTPLGAIIGFIDLILDPESSADEKRQYLEVVRRNANQLLQIVNEVLDLSKIEAQKLQIEKEIVPLDDLMEDIRLLMALKAEDKGLVFKIEEMTSLPKRIYTDPLRLKQILINLIGNAIKFTSMGEVTVRIKSVKDDNGNKHLIFDIEDTGPGIHEESAKELFQPFSQGDKSYMRKFGGTGLGLSLSKSLATLLGGELQLLRSEVGKGSTFRLKIESVVKKDKTELAAQESKLSTEGFDLKDKKILVVDDSPDNQILISQYLTIAGAKFDIAKNGVEALECVQNEPNYNVILMDLQMPVMDGYEATRIMQQQGCRIPIVAFTAHAMKEEKDKSQIAGFSGYLTKPVERQRLITILSELSK